MCDKNEVKDMNCDQSWDQFQSSQPCEYSAADQFENAENCENCKVPDFCPPSCNQCPQTPGDDFQSFVPAFNTQFPTSCAPDQSFAQYHERRDFEQNQQERPCAPCDMTSYDPCNPCIQRCDPCEPFGPCPMPCGDDCQPRYPCPPMETCSPMCSPYSRRRYVQPPRRESCKPIIRYQRPSLPMTSDTIYKNSFECIDAQTAASCRMPPVRPSGELRSACGQFAKETVTKLSFQPFCRPERAHPIYPHSPSLLGQGPMQALTTNKHDFVPKFQYKPGKCMPQDNIRRLKGCFEGSTIQKLSFMKPDLCNFSKSESCKPVICYQPPQLPMEFETTQKLSFMPNRPAPKELYPWAQKAKYCPPSIRFAKDTVAQLSYQPPGCFMDDNQNCCEVACDNAPRASC